MALSLHLEGVIREGVYTMVGGPNYETVAELNLLRELGVDSVGKIVRIYNKINCEFKKCRLCLYLFRHEHDTRDDCGPPLWNKGMVNNIS